MRCRRLLLLSLAALALLAAMPSYAQAVSVSGPTNFAVGDGPYSVAVGDFNGDGNPDSAVANYGSDDVSVLFDPARGRRLSAIV